MCSLGKGIPEKNEKRGLSKSVLMRVFDSNKNNFQKVLSFDREKANGETLF